MHSIKEANVYQIWSKQSLSWGESSKSFHHLEEVPKREEELN